MDSQVSRLVALAYRLSNCRNRDSRRSIGIKRRATTLGHVQPLHTVRQVSGTVASSWLEIGDHVPSLVAGDTSTPIRSTRHHHPRRQLARHPLEDLVPIPPSSSGGTTASWDTTDYPRVRSASASRRQRESPPRSGHPAPRPGVPATNPTVITRSRLRITAAVSMKSVNRLPRSDTAKRPPSSPICSAPEPFWRLKSRTPATRASGSS